MDSQEPRAGKDAAPASGGKARGPLVGIAKALVGAAVIAYVIYSGRLDFAKIMDADWRWILAAWGVLLTIPFLGWLRWHAVLQMQDIRVGLLSTLRIQLIGVLFNAVLLGGVGGDVVKAYYIAIGGGSSKKAAAAVTVVIDRVIGVFGVIVVMGLGLLVTAGALLRRPTVAAIMLSLCTVYGICFVGMLVLMIPRFRRSRHEYLKRQASKGRGFKKRLAAAVDEMDGAIQELLKHPGWTALCVAISIAGHALSVVAFFFFFKGLGVRGVPFSVFAVLVPLTLAANGLPVLPLGGLGAGELVASELFSQVLSAGVEAGKAAGGTTMFLWRIGLYLTAPAGLVFFALQRDDVRRAFDAAREARSGRKGVSPDGEDASATETDERTGDVPP